MTKYGLAVANHPDKLASEVNKMLAEGWQLQGGVSCTVDYYRRETYCQAMIKESVK